MTFSVPDADSCLVSAAGSEPVAPVPGIQPAKALPAIPAASINANNFLPLIIILLAFLSLENSSPIFLGTVSLLNCTFINCPDRNLYIVKHNYNCLYEVYFCTKYSFYFFHKQFIYNYYTISYTFPKYTNVLICIKTVLLFKGINYLLHALFPFYISCNTIEL